MSVPILPKSFIRVLAKALGGVFVLLYEYCGFILLQMFIKTAVDKDLEIGGRILNPLQEWGKLVDIYKDPGQQAEHTLRILVLTQGGTLTSGTRFVDTATGVIHVLAGDAALDSSFINVTIRSTRTGDIGNLDSGYELSFVNAPPSCEKICTINARTTDGTDVEDTEHLRDRIKIRWASRPQGGAYADYWDWATAVPGVKNAYPYSGWDIDGLDNSGSGTVVIFIESLTGTDGIPTEALREDVLDAIQLDSSGLANRRPINAYTDLSLVRPITRTTFDVSVGGLISDNEEALKTEIENGLTDYFLGREPFINGLSLFPRMDTVTISDVNGTVGRIAAASNGIALNIALEVAGSPVTDYYQLQEGEKAKLGTLTWS